MKFLHTLGAVGLAGGLAAYMMVLSMAPEYTELLAYANLREGLAFVSKWLLVPAMMVVLVSGLLSMAVHHPFQNAPWVWVKALSGILIFEATLASIDAPSQGAMRVAMQALEGEITPQDVARLVRDEWGAWWMILALSVANVLLAIWRPRFGLRRD